MWCALCVAIVMEEAEFSWGEDLQADMDTFDGASPFACCDMSVFVSVLLQRK